VDPGFGAGRGRQEVSAIEVDVEANAEVAAIATAPGPSRRRSRRHRSPRGVQPGFAQAGSITPRVVPVRVADGPPLDRHAHGVVVVRVVDLEAGTVLVRRTWTRQRLGPTKTGHERRVSFGHPIVEDTLEWRPRADVIDTMITRIRRLKRTPLDPTGFLFTQPDGRPWSSSSMNSAWRRVLAKAGVRYRPAEQLRHTVASTLLSRGAPLL